MAIKLIKTTKKKVSHTSSSLHKEVVEDDRLDAMMRDGVLTANVWIWKIKNCTQHNTNYIYIQIHNNDNLFIYKDSEGDHLWKQVAVIDAF